MYTYRYSRERSEQVSSYCPVCRKQRIWQKPIPRLTIVGSELCCSKAHGESYKNYIDNLRIAQDDFIVSYCKNKKYSASDIHEQSINFFNNLLLTKVNQLKKYSLQIEKVTYAY